MPADEFDDARAVLYGPMIARMLEILTKRGLLPKDVSRETSAKPLASEDESA